MDKHTLNTTETRRPICRQAPSRLRAIGRRFLACAAVTLLAAPAAAQAPAPNPDVWLARLSRADGVTRIADARNITQRVGYDNQPWFLPDGSGLLYVAEHDGQTDVYRYRFATRAAEQVTRTPQWREYSPTLSDDGRVLRVVRWDRPVEHGALWRYSPTGEPLTEQPGGVANVGYYAWPDSATLALFVNDSVRSFVVTPLASLRPDTVTTGIGGSAPQRVPGTRAVSVLTRDDAGDWWITRYEPAVRRFTPLVRTLRGGMQYAWTRRGTLLMAHGSTVYEWDPRGGPGWLTVATLPGLRNISRIAVSANEDQVALVAEPAEP